jgi:anti-sigma B factor antagonist
MSPDPTPDPFHLADADGGTTASFPAGTALAEAHVEALVRRLPALIAARGHAPLTLDLGGVAASSSGALGKLLGLNRAVRAAEGRLVLVNPSPALRRVLRLTRLDTVLTVRAAEPVPA